MKVLLTGAKGQLGKCFTDIRKENVLLIPLDSKSLDICDREKVISLVEQYKPDVIINCAAYTSVDRAEVESQQAVNVNSFGPANLAIAAKNIGSKLIHISTDYVFDGYKSEPYVETDLVNPRSVYGKTKLAGELLIQSIFPESVILRTSWVFSEHGNNFLKTMLRIGRDKNEINVVSDQLGCPTYAGDIANAVYNMIDCDASGGIYHFCGGEKISWAGFSEYIFQCAFQMGYIQIKPKVNFITTSEFPTLAARPSFSVMSTSKISHFTPPSDWKKAVMKVISLIN
ncbi:dTDP-4-dehydrorhamnose reductase [Tatumella citrea]|uniref:dTDP-4-dehydrorhamnose reductase n=2 Tax=Tatumella citrea TaxID=53336 RepID=A0A1Y0LD96_TATCI|nr:dTDP-4-dehydrorhamnose reductase [Tatumella citrea]ARV00070.1 dTDP-4-dehydrorhamnose reductase [Tatumella citrea]